MSLRIKKYILLLGIFFGEQQMQGMDLFFQAASTIGQDALTIAQSNAFLFGLMPGIFNDYVVMHPLVKNSLGNVPGVNKMIYRKNDKDYESLSSRLSFKYSTLHIRYYKYNQISYVEAWKLKTNLNQEMK